MHPPQQARRGIGPGGPSSIITLETQTPFPLRRSPRRAVPAALSGPRGLRCWGKYPGAFPRFSAFSPGRRGAGCARCLFRPIFLCCSLYHAPGLFPCLFIFSLAGPARRRSPFSLPFGKKRKNPRPSMLRSLNEHRLLHLLLPHPRLLPSCARPVSPCLRLLTSPRTCS